MKTEQIKALADSIKEHARLIELAEDSNKLEILLDISLTQLKIAEEGLQKIGAWLLSSSL